MKLKISLIIVTLIVVISAPAQNQLLIPDTISGTDFELTLKKGKIQFFEGIATNTFGVNGNILGPTLIMNKEDYVSLKVNNQLEETTTIHWHGMHVSASNDGGPHTLIAPNEIWNPRFKVMDKAGTYWYHPHLHENTNKHVSLGIAGFIIVRDKEEALLNLPRNYGIDDFPLVIQTKDFNESNQIVVPSNNDNVLMVNATVNPFLKVPAQIVRLRLLNGSSQRVFNLGLSGNLNFHQIASDGGLLKSPVPLKRLQLAPGERAEILIDFSGKQSQSVQLKSFASELQNGIYGAANAGIGAMIALSGYNPNPLNGTDFSIIEFKVVSPSEKPVNSIPSLLANVSRLSESSANIKRQLNITPAVMGMNQLNGKFLINGLIFNMDVINFSIHLNNTEIWSISNQSAIAHPFHIHDVQFYILDRNGVEPVPGEQGRKDVALVKPMETVRLITEFTDFANDSVPYMLHCHMLSHEDDGMMLQFEVVDKTTATSDKKMNSYGIQVFPNPLNINDRKLTVTGVKGKLLKVELYSISGQKITGTIISSNSNQTEIAIPELPAGIYLLIFGNEQTAFTKKIEVQ